ncbi:UpxY family transcription antiterminator [Inquilinus sp. KBS0705]|nr:UpxY family transcription antiterminator [Inquilinus sp. KBS0705]
MKKIESKNWIVLYTRSRWEKRVSTLLTEQNFKSYCPIVRTNRLWADRRKTVEIPLFNSYVFVYADQYDLIKILQTTGVVTYVSYCGRPAHVDETEINRIRSIANTYTDIETISLNNLNIGDEVKIKEGPLVDTAGQVQYIQGKVVVMIIKNLNCALTVKVNKEDLLPA